LARQRIMSQGGTCDEQGTLGAELRQVEWRHWAAGLPVEHHVTPRRQTIEAFFEGRLGDRIIDDLHPLSIRKALYLSLEILLRIENHLICAGFFGQFRLVLRRYRAEDPRAAPLGHLHQ